MTEQTQEQELGRELEMYLRLATTDKSGGALEPEEQTPVNLASLRNLQEEGLVKPFHINSPEEIEEKIRLDKRSRGVPIEQILLQGDIPHAAMPDSHYEEIRKMLRKLDVRFTPYSQNILHNALDNLGLGFLGYPTMYSVQSLKSWNQSNQILVFEHFLYRLHLDPTLKDYEAPFHFTKKGLYDFARKENVIEGDLEKGIILTSLGKEFVQSMMQSFDRLRKVPNMNPKWAKYEY